MRGLLIALAMQCACVLASTSTQVSDVNDLTLSQEHNDTPARPYLESTDVPLPLLPLSLMAPPVSYYVSPDGDDANDGRSARTPWETPGRALAAITFMRAGGPLTTPVVVYLAPGLYLLGEPMVIAPHSGGTGNASVTFQPLSHAAGDVTLSGGRRITGWVQQQGTSDVYTAVLDAVTWPQSFVRQLFVPRSSGGFDRRYLTSTPVFREFAVMMWVCTLRSLLASLSTTLCQSPTCKL